MSEHLDQAEKKSFYSVDTANLKFTLSDTLGNSNYTLRMQASVLISHCYSWEIMSLYCEFRDMTFSTLCFKITLNVIEYLSR